MPDEPTLDNALTDVRKAYRLLWCYQKRIFDMVKLVVEDFDDMTFYNWRTLHAGPPCRTDVDPTSRWAWDMLPMVQVCYLFLPGGCDRNATIPGQWMLAVFVNSDGGFSHSEDGSEPDPADLETAGESTSTISLFAWYCRGETSRNWLGGVWNVLRDWPEADGEKVDYADPPFTIFRRDFDLATLPDKDAVRAAAASFRTTASEALGVDLA